MIVTRIILKNWRNFRHVDVSLQARVFLVGPNASGKSNFLDVFRFLRDIVRDGGGLQYAIDERGGLANIRCLAASREADVEIEVQLATLNQSEPHHWTYAIGVRREPKGIRRPILTYERVEHNGKIVLERPAETDRSDKLQLTQTHLEQLNANANFRDIAHFCSSIQYQHIVPQLVRRARAYTAAGIPGDPFGRSFLERIAATNESRRKARLQKIGEALAATVPQLKALFIERDEIGEPHLEVIHEHSRSRGVKQTEDQLSDGTLRLIGLLWSLLDGDSLLLLEEPELSLHASIVSRLPALIYRLQQRRNRQPRQVILSTHSAEFLRDNGIGGEEVLLFLPGVGGTSVKNASEDVEIRHLLDSGLSAGEAVLPFSKPARINQLDLFQ